jgi:hypothetical protein
LYDWTGSLGYSQSKSIPHPCTIGIALTIAMLGLSVSTFKRSVTF